jgi:hypothetical protein
VEERRQAERCDENARLFEELVAEQGRP